MRQTEKVWVGIDVAFAKNKPLPVCVCRKTSGKLDPFPLKRDFEKPPVGRGNKASLDIHNREKFANEVLAWLTKLERELALKIDLIAIDAPSDYCRPELERRKSEQALDRAHVSCFTTPTRASFDQKVADCQRFLQEGGKVSRLPNANQLWMLVGFGLFKQLKREYLCIETFPQAIIRELRCDSGHKSTGSGLSDQISTVAIQLGLTPENFKRELMAIGFGSKHDKLDAFLSAWVASLDDTERKCYGEPPNDAIWVPRLA